MINVAQIKSDLAQPSQSMSWFQLGAAAVFVVVVMFAWRQVTHFIMGEL